MLASRKTPVRDTIQQNYHNQDQKQDQKQDCHEGEGVCRMDWLAEHAANEQRT